MNEIKERILVLESHIEELEREVAVLKEHEQALRLAELSLADRGMI